MKNSVFNIDGMLQGGFNSNSIVEDSLLGKRYLIREPHSDHPSLLEKIEDEFQRYGGWLDSGNSVRKRSMKEQIAFMTKATRNGLRTIDIACIDHNRIVLPFIEDAQTLDDYLPSASLHEAESLVHNLFVDLHKAHREHGMVYGDRWAKNMLIDSKDPRNPIHIDFDLQYEGPNAMDMDVGRMTFYVLQAGGKKVIPPLVEGLIACGWHDLDFVECIVRGQAEYFHGTQFGNAGENVDVLFQTLQKTLEKVSMDISEAMQICFRLNGQNLNRHLQHEIGTLRVMTTDILYSYSS